MYVPLSACEQASWQAGKEGWEAGCHVPSYLLPQSRCSGRRLPLSTCLLASLSPTALTKGQAPCELCMRTNNSGNSDCEYVLSRTMPGVLGTDSNCRWSMEPFQI